MADKIVPVSAFRELNVGSIPRAAKDSDIGNDYMDMLNSYEDSKREVSTGASKPHAESSYN